MTTTKTIDATGLACPLPLLKAKQGLHQIDSGERLMVIATDAGSVRDVQAFIGLTEHQLISFEETASDYRYLIQKG